MNRETFLETIKTHLTDEIHAAYVQCEHGKDVDYTHLTHLLGQLRDAAKSEGLAHTEFEDIVKSQLPGVWDRLKWKPQAA